MSMINQMLKDLDSRRVAAIEAQPMLADVQLSASSTRKFVKPVALTLLAVAIGLGLYARFRQTQAPGAVTDGATAIPTIVTLPVQSEPSTVAPVETRPLDSTLAKIEKNTDEVGAVKQGSAAVAPSASGKKSANDNTEETPESALQRWFAAYSSGDSDTYFKAYAKNFVPPNGTSVSRWKQQRRSYFERGSKAKIEMLNVRIDINGAQAKTHFHQRFRSAGYKDDVNKTLSWQLIDGHWQIISETSQPYSEPTAEQNPVASETPANQGSNGYIQRPAVNRAAAVKSVNPKQASANLYRDAVTMVQEGRLSDAQDALNLALDADPANHNARQVLSDLLIDAGRRREAIVLLGKGLSIAPAHSGFCMALARLHLASGAKQDALTILQQGLSNAGDDGEYHGFLAALLQTFGRHDEATKHYLIALRSDPLMSKWLVGIGISLKAQKKLVDAAEAFQRAIDTGELSTEVADFSRLQIDQIRRSR